MRERTQSIFGPPTLIEPETRHRFPQAQADGGHDGVYLAQMVDCDGTPLMRGLQIHRDKIYIVKARGYDLRPFHIGEITGPTSASVMLPSDEGMAAPVVLEFFPNGDGRAVWRRAACDVNVALAKTKKSLPYDAAFEKRVASMMPAFLPASKQTPEEVRHALSGKVLLHNWAAEPTTLVARYFRPDGTSVAAEPNWKGAPRWAVDYRTWEMTGSTTVLLLGDSRWGTIAHLHEEPDVFTVSDINGGQSHPTWWIGVLGECWPEQIVKAGVPDGARRCTVAEEDRLSKRFEEVKATYSVSAIR